jgi:F0F1-type ATP synthase alpha subunit
MKDVFVSSDNLLNLAKNLLSQGKVLSVVDGVVIISGLKTVKSGETLEFFDNDENVVLTGMALNLNVMTVGAVLFGDERLVKPGNVVRGTGTIISVPVGMLLLGRVVNALGVPIDGLGA